MTCGAMHAHECITSSQIHVICPTSSSPLPSRDFPPHCKIAHETVERVLERRGPVLLEEKMAHPSKGISCHRNNCQESRGSTGQRHGGRAYCHCRANEMQPPAGGVGVFAWRGSGRRRTEKRSISSNELGPPARASPTRRPCQHDVHKQASRRTKQHMTCTNTILYADPNQRMGLQ